MISNSIHNFSQTAVNTLKYYIMSRMMYFISMMPSIIAYFIEMYKQSRIAINIDEEVNGEISTPFHPHLDSRNAGAS